MHRFADAGSSVPEIRRGSPWVSMRVGTCSLLLHAVTSPEMTRVIWGRFVDKQIRQIPELIVRKFRLWVALVEESGIREVRKSKGFHDEPLKGQRQGQRSVRLNRAYRAIYVQHETGEVELIEVVEVNKHAY